MLPQQGQEFGLHAAGHEIIVPLVAAWLLPAFLLAQAEHLLKRFGRNVGDAPLSDFSHVSHVNNKPGDRLSSQLYSGLAGSAH